MTAPAPPSAPPPFPSPADWRDLWIYFLLVDRFDNPAAPPRHAWDEPYGGFQGGTLDGITARLDFLRDLGVGALWLSPILANVPSQDGTYHGYGIADFTRVEPRFCADPARAATDPAYADTQLRTLVDAAHARGLYVVFDIVLNHAGDVFAYDGLGGQAPWHQDGPYPIHWRDAAGNPDPDWPTAPADPPTGAAVGPAALRRDDAFRRQGNAFGTAGHDPVSAGDFFTLKEMVTGLTDEAGRFPVRDALIAAYADLIRRFDVDGFRIDTLMYIEPDFSQSFGNAMREYAEALGKKNFFTFGEVYADEARISGFVGRRAGSGGDLVGVDAALDFPLFYALPGMAKGSTVPRALVDLYALRRSLEDGVISSHGDASRYFVTFLDNHDQDSRFSYVDPADPARYAPQTTLGLAALMTLQGVPCVYYGTEAGLHGSGSAPEAVREALWGAPDAFSLDAPVATVLRALTAVRAASPELRYGRQYFRPVSGDGVSFGHSPYPGGVAAWSRILADREVVVVANTSTTQAWTGQVVIDATLSDTVRPVGAGVGPATGPVRSPRLVWSNRPAGAVGPGAPVDHPNGSVNIDDGVTRTLGPARAVPVTLAPMELQVFTTTP